MKRVLFLTLGLILIIFSCKKEVAKHQIVSPINIQSAQKDSALKPLAYSFYTEDTIFVKIKDSILTVKIPETSVILPDSANPELASDYTMEYMKFYFPSEHTVEGKNYEGEVQIFFKKGNNWVAVAYFLSKSTDTNNVYKILTDNLPVSKDTFFVDTNGINFRSFLPLSLSYWYYEGTFTDNAKKLRWFIYQDPVYLAEYQLDNLKKSSKGKTHKIRSQQNIIIKTF